MLQEHSRPIALLAVLLMFGAQAAAQTTVVRQPDGGSATVTVQSDGATGTIMIVGAGGAQSVPGGVGGVQINGVQFGAGPGLDGGAVGGALALQGGVGVPFVQPSRDQPLAVGTSRIRGRVVAAGSGSPVRRAIVRLSAPGIRESRAATTDQDGRYEFLNLPAANYNLVA